MALISKKTKFEILSLISPNKNIEIEAKIKRKSENGLTAKQFQKIKDYFLAQEDYQIENYTHTDYYIGKDRITFDGEEYTETSKSLLKNKYINLDDFTVKISISEEKSFASKEPEEYNFTRTKHRFSFKKDNLSIDLTEAKKDDSTTYEAEVEVIDASLFESTFNPFVDTVELIYNLVSQGKIVKFIKESFITDDINIDRNVSKARDLKIQDLTAYGILKPFAIASKVDGINRFLIIHSEGIYLYYPRREESETLIFLSPLLDSFKAFENSIFAGELYQDKYYVPFDSLIFRNEDIREDNYLERKSKSDQLTGMKLFKGEQEYLLIKSKPLFTYQSNVEDFNRACRQAFEEEKSADYQTDGLIFTPINSPYIARGQHIMKKEDRILSKNLDVCKYKRPEDLTADFLVKSDGLYDSKGKKFVGTKRFPFGKQNYDQEKANLYLGKVVEFEPQFKDRGYIVYTPKKVRLDKPPNAKFTLENLWALVNDPIQEATLKGESTQLMRKNNSTIKSRSIFPIFSDYVVDIGFGKGGDYMKYLANRKVDKVLAIEPDKEKLEVFEQRFPMRNDDYIQTVNCGGEDFELILNKAESFFPASCEGRNFYISLMISLSFFWKSKEMLMKLVQTIHSLEKLYQTRGGDKEFAVVYYTIEGERLLKLFDSKGNKLRLNSIVLKRVDQNQVYIDITDSATVSAQTEYFVFLRDLWKGSSFYPENEFNLEFSKKDLLMTKNELTYDSLFVYGKAKRSEMKIPEKESIDCLEVDENIGVKTKLGVLAKGDDRYQEISDSKHLYRMANMTIYGSLYHAFLKALSKDYRQGDVYKRKDMAQKLAAKVKDNLEDLANYFGIAVLLFGDKKINSTLR